MSAASAQIDWPGLRAAAVAVGVREAARRAAADLPDDERERFTQRVMKRCSRERWLATAAAHREQAPTKQRGQPLSAIVRNGAETIAETLAARRDQTRLGLSRYVERMSTDAAELAGLSDAQNVRHVASVAAQVWPEQAAGATINIALLVQ